MADKVRFLLKNISLFTLGEVGTKIISFFLVPLYTHVLTTNQYGTIDLIFTISVIITPLIMLNIGEAMMRFLLDENVDHNKIMSVGIIVFIFGVIISLLIVPIASKIEILSNYKWYMYFYIILFSTKSLLTGYLRGMNKLQHYAICNILNAFLIAIFNILFLVVLDMGIEGYFLAYILAEACAIIYAIIYGKIFYSIKKFNFDKNLSKSMIIFSLAIVPNSLLWWVINSSERIMVTTFRGLSENGLLAVSYKIPSLLVVLNTIFTQSWKYSAIKEKDSCDNEKFTNEMFDKYIRLIIILSAFLILIIKILVKLLFSSSYYNSWISSCFLLMGFVFSGISTFIGTVYYVKKDMVGNMLSALFGAIINIFLNILFIPVIGFSGAAIATMLCYLYILLYRYYDTKKYQKIKLFKKDYIFLLILIVVMIVGNLLDNLYGNIILILGFICIFTFNYKYIRNNLKKIIKLTLIMKKRRKYEKIIK